MGGPGFKRFLLSTVFTSRVLLPVAERAQQLMCSAPRVILQ
jgi:hypothetical protein